MKCHSCNTNVSDSNFCNKCGHLDDSGYPISGKRSKDGIYFVEEPTMKKGETITTVEEITKRIEKAVSKTKGYFIATGTVVLIGIVAGIFIYNIEIKEYGDPEYDTEEYIYSE